MEHASFPYIAFDELQVEGELDRQDPLMVVEDLLMVVLLSKNKLV